MKMAQAEMEQEENGTGGMVLVENSNKMTFKFSFRNFKCFLLIRQCRPYDEILIFFIIQHFTE